MTAPTTTNRTAPTPSSCVSTTTMDPSHVSAAPSSSPTWLPPWTWDRNQCAGTTTVPASWTVSFTDPGSFDTHSATVDWGDGSPLVEVDPVTSPFTESHTYADPGTFDTMVCVTDGESTPTCEAGSALVSSVNEAPVADAGGPYGGSEGVGHPARRVSLVGSRWVDRRAGPGPPTTHRST